MSALQTNLRIEWKYPGIEQQIMQRIRSEFSSFILKHADTGSDLDSAEIILGEVLSNIVHHASSGFHLLLDWGNEWMKMHLDANGPGFAEFPTLTQSQDAMSTDSKGLLLISKLSHVVEVQRRPFGGLTTTISLPVRRSLTSGL